MHSRHSKRKEFLVFSFVRESYKQWNHIPNEVILLFAKWINDRYYIHISQDLMAKFVSTKKIVVSEPAHAILPCYLHVHIRISTVHKCYTHVQPHTIAG